jgi:alkyl hydroperoxide reductase subunit AhpC
LQDFHPKGEMAKKYDVYLEDKGITDRATVIVDKQGVVRYAASVTPAGERNPKDLLGECQRVNKG